MKYVFSLAILAILYSFSVTNNIYSLSVKTMDGKNIDLSSFKGKKILIVILPVSATDTSVTTDELSRVQTRYQTSLIVIGIPAEEAGFNKHDEANVKELYKDQKSNFILAEGMKVKKATRGQTSVFQWLTNKDKNHHYDRDVEGTGHKFFIDEQGELYAVMGPKIKFWHPMIDRILSKPIKKTN